MTILPFFPPTLNSDEPCGGHIGPEPRHFVVEEIPAYPLSGEGEHVFVWVEKEGANTADVAKRLAAAAQMRDRDIGYAGMKDKHAITRQWFSLCTKAEDVSSWDLGPQAKILKATRHGNKLRTGHLIGNRFSITLVDVPEDGRQRAPGIAQQLIAHGLPNYFGAQRFGREGQNLAKALAWLQTAPSAEPQPEQRSKRDRRRKGKRGDRFDNKLLPSVIQSEVFNRYLAARLACEDELLLGEVVRLDGTGTSFVVDDLDKELPRYREKDLHLTGPMIGPKGLQAEAAARELELRIIADLGLTDAQLDVLAAHAPGTRRDLMLHPETLEVSAGDPGELTVSFTLPAGAYATQLIREFSGAAWMTPRGEAPVT